MLTAKHVERTKTPGRYRCGLVKGLLLQISASGARSWVLRYELHGKERMMGLGSAAEFSLSQARERALAARHLLADGVDPLATKQAAKAAAKLGAARKLTFREAAHLPRETGNPFIFTGHRPGSGLSRKALPYVMGRVGQDRTATVHGFRLSFSNWSHEQTAHSTHTIEISLAHRVGNETERAYRRTDMIAKRRQLQESWSRFCTTLRMEAEGEVVALRGER